MSIVKHFVDGSIRNLEIDEYLSKELNRAGYGGVEITRTPLGTRVIIYAMKPGFVIGRRGTNIRDLAKNLEEKFKLPSPQIAVSEIETPELNPKIMAARIAEALLKGTHFRRIGFWSLENIMKAGALGVEIVISGKLTTQRHRKEKYRAGYLPKAGDPVLKNVRTSVSHVKLKPGLLGIKVKIVPPDAMFPDKIEMKSVKLEEEIEEVEAAQKMETNKEQEDEKENEGS